LKQLPAGDYIVTANNADNQSMVGKDYKGDPPNKENSFTLYARAEKSEVSFKEKPFPYGY
jgi:hypothetical protein